MDEKKFNINPHLKTARTDFIKNTLLEKECEADPFIQFESWLTEAIKTGNPYANAMTLSTVSGNMPDSRVVLLRDLSYGGFTFFTNYNSDKGKQITINPNACLLFFWQELERQVKVQGEIRFLPSGESDNYFNSRPFESQVGAWASQQSEVVKDRETLDGFYDEQLKKYTGKEVPRPRHWGGYVLIPSKFEFWQGRKSRLHDRIKYEKQSDGPGWKMQRLMP